MKALVSRLKDLFRPEHGMDISIDELHRALGDSSVRSIVMDGILSEIERINIEVDRRLLVLRESGISDLCARRKAFQDVLESIRSARRRVTQEVRPNPTVKSSIDLDRVTA